MKADLKSICSPDMDIENVSDETGDFPILLELVVGLSHREGGDIFEIDLHLLPQMPTTGESYYEFSDMKLFGYNIRYGSLRDYLKTYCSHLTGGNWLELVEKMKLISRWEYEGYRE